MSATPGSATPPRAIAAADAPDAPENPSLVGPAIVYALIFGAVGAWPPFSTVYFGSLGIDLGWIGVLSAIPAAVSIVAAPAWGVIADRLGDVRPPIVVAGLWTTAIAVVLTFQPPVALLGILVGLMAAGSAGLVPLVDARTVQRLGRDRERYGRARLWGSISFMVVTIGVGGLIAATSLVSSLAAYALLLAGAVVASAALLGRSRRAATVASISAFAVMRLLRDRQLLAFFIGLVIVWTAANGIMTFFSLRIIQLGGDAELVGIGWAVNAVAEVPVMFAFAALSRRFGTARLMVFGAVMFAVRAVGWTFVDSATASVVVTTLGGIGYAFVVVGTTSYIPGRVPRELRATAQGLFMGTTYALGTILGAVLAGLVAQREGLSVVFPAGVVASLIGALVVWVAVGGGRDAPSVVRAQPGPTRP